jgi:ribA/ribD-fused uncharacterized protein
MTKISGFFGNYRWLSNFWQCFVEYEGVIYPSSEHAFQAAKTLSKIERIKIANLKTPNDAKGYGRTMTVRSDWELVKVSEMGKIVMAKFTQNSILKEKLMNTGEAELIEGNTWGDTFWGICDGIGSNNLGKILMLVRAALKVEVK